MEKKPFPVDIRVGLRQNSVCAAAEERSITAVFAFLTFALSRFILEAKRSSCIVMVLKTNRCANRVGRRGEI